MTDSLVNASFFLTISQALGCKTLGKIFATKFFEELFNLKHDGGNRIVGNLFVAVIMEGQRKVWAFNLKVDGVNESLNHGLFCDEFFHSGFLISGFLIVYVIHYKAFPQKYDKKDRP